MWHLTLSKCNHFVVLSRWSALQSGDYSQSDLFAPDLDLDDDDDVGDPAQDSLPKQSVDHNHPNLFAPDQDPGSTRRKKQMTYTTDVI